MPEGAGAAGLAALLSHGERFKGRRVGLVLSGGNIDTRLLASVLLRGLVCDGRIVRLWLMIGDLPGQLARVAGLIGKAGGNIIEVQHQRLFRSVVAKATELDVTVEARGRGQVRELVVALGGGGFTVRVLEGRTSNPMLRQHPKHGPARTGDGGRDPTGRLPWPSPSSSVTSSTPSSAPPSRSMPSAA